MVEILSLLGLRGFSKHQASNPPEWLSSGVNDILTHVLVDGWFRSPRLPMTSGVFNLSHLLPSGVLNL
jgi:hypothetical protein